MTKWFENHEVDNSIVISSRVRLARNLKNYAFPHKLKKEELDSLLEKIEAAAALPDDKELRLIEVDLLTPEQKLSLMERHMISLLMVEKTEKCGVLVSDDEKLSVLLNEEDHIRIQSVTAGECIEEAYSMAMEMDDRLEKTVEYAFDENYGYLTACPTNVGTGMRASYMMHLPCLEATGQMRNVIGAISKFGVTARGIYGEGTEPMGSIYQISNQVTLGQTEEEIIQNLNRVSMLVTEQEKRMCQKLLNESRNELEDKIYRSYGILTHARQISASEAMTYLSNLRIGFMLGFLDVKKPKDTIYNIMMHTQPGSLKKRFGKEIDGNKSEQLRASYIRQELNR